MAQVKMFLVCSASLSLPLHFFLPQSPPAHPWPQVAAELGNLESQRAAAEKQGMKTVDQAFNEAFADAQRQIRDVISKSRSFAHAPEKSDAACSFCDLLRRCFFICRFLVNRFRMFLLDALLLLLRRALRTSFREAPQQSLFGRVLSFRVNVLPSSPPDSSLKSRIDSIEHERSESEEQIFQNARSEAKALTSFVVGELQVIMLCISSFSCACIIFFCADMRS